MEMSVIADGRRIHVVAAAVFDHSGRVLIARRPAHVHQGGLWEFPGGKLEQGETAIQGLQRELEEELGIRVDTARPLIQVRHDYPDRQVLLDVWRVDSHTGTARGLEGQPVAWVAPEELEGYTFPAANLPIIKALQLPDRYLITPEPGADSGAFLESLEGALANGISLLQLRARRLPSIAFARLAADAAELCRSAGARLLLNCDPRQVPDLGAQGVHLTARRLMNLKARPLGAGYMVAASCHNAAEVRQARDLGVDFIVISPVRETASHPDARPLGLEGLHSLCEIANVPAYALGGMQAADIDTVQRYGARGIAAIRGLWP